MRLSLRHLFLTALLAGTMGLPLFAQPWTLSTSPTSGNAANQNFVFTFTHPLGYQNLDVVNVLINRYLDGGSACYLAYSQPANVLYLVPDVGPGGALLVAPTSNSQCTVNSWSTSKAGPTLALNVNLSFSSAFAANIGGNNANNKVIYLASRDLSLNSGWQPSGVWRVPPTASSNQQALSLSPARNTSQTVQYSAVLADNSTNFQGLGTVNILINSAIDGNRACYLAYVKDGPTYLVGDDGATLMQLNQPGSVSNSQCTVNPGNTNTSTIGNQRTANLNVTFNNAWTGSKVVYIAARNDAGASSSDWQALGTWMQTGGGGNVTPTSVTPSSGSGTSQLFVVHYADPFGPSDIADGKIHFNSSSNGQSGNNACQVEWTALGSLSLISSFGVVTGTFGGANPISNTFCTVDTSASSLTSTANGYDVRVKVTFNPTFINATTSHQIYASGRNAAGTGPPAVILGTWNTPPPSTAGTITSNPASRTIVQGGTAQYPLTITPPSGFTGAMVLSTSSLPPGTSANFSPSSVTGNSSSVLAIGTNFPNTPTGTYSIIVSAVGGGIVQAQSTVTMIVTAGGGSTISSSSTVIPFGWVSPAETLMFNSNTNTGTAPWYFSVVIQNAGTFAANGNVVAMNACYVQYLAPGNVLVLYADDGMAVVNPGGSTPGTQHQFSNSRCTLDITRSYVQTIGGAMTLHLALTFEPTWSGVKEMFVDTRAAGESELYWTNRGSWTVPSNKLIPVTTDHYDVFRTGANVHETILTPATAGSLAVKNSFPLDNCAWAQPLYVPNVSISGVLHNVLYVATSNATIYAYDADSTTPNPSPLWMRNLGTPYFPTSAGAGYRDIWDCSNGNAQGPAGIIGTPVIDLATNTLYVVGNINIAVPPAQTSLQKLYAIDLASGILLTTPATIASSGGIPAFSANYHNQRPGLLLADFRLMFGYSSFGDSNNYQGWMFSYNRNLGLLDNWNYANAGFTKGSGIWMSAGGPAFDGRKIYFSTGNPIDDSYSAAQYANSLLQVDPIQGSSPGTSNIGLANIVRYLPPQASLWPNTDLDLGSSRVIVVPGTNFSLVGGKAGNIYVVDRTTLQQAYQPFHVGDNGTVDTLLGPEISGGLAYWNGQIFVWPAGESLKAFSLSGGSPVLSTNSGIPSGEQAAAISLSSNFDNFGTGLVWSIVPNGTDASHTYSTPGTLQVFNATNLSWLKTYSLNTNNENQTDSYIKFIPPIVANGKVFVATGGHAPAIQPRVLVFGQ